MKHRFPRSGRPRLSIMACGASAFFDLYITQGLLPQFRRVFDASVGQVSLTVTVATLAVAFAAPFAGRLSDRFGRRRVLLSALVALALATLGGALAHTLPQLLAWRVVQGLCIPGIFASAVAYIGEEFPPEHSAQMTSYYILGAVLGGVAGRFLSGIIAAHAPWQWAFACMGILNLLVALFIAWSLPPSRNFGRGRGQLPSAQDARAQLRQRQFLATLGIGFCLLFAQVGTFTYVNFYLAAPPYGLSAHDLSFLSGVFLAGAIGPVISTRLAPRFEARAVLSGALAVSSLGVIATLGHGIGWVLLGLTLNSAGVFVGQQMATSTLPRLVPDARSFAVGLYLTCYYLGGSLGASAPSLAYVHWGWPAVVALMIIVQCVASALAWFTWGSRRRSPDEVLRPVAGEATG